MSAAPTAAEIARDATWLAQALDATAGLARLVRMTPESYRDASFLDDRMFQKARHETFVVPWAEVAAAALGIQRNDACWILHIGHVGSTLVARLLGEVPGVLSIREPRSLRDVAALPAEQRGAFTGPLQALLSRTFSPGERVLVKATSFVSQIAPELVPVGECALFIYAAPRAYIASILAGENSVKEMMALARSRAQRMANRANLPQPKSASEMAAAAWASEMTSLEAAAQAMPDRQIAWADFDTMLGNMPRELGRVAAFFRFDAEPDRVRAIAGGPLMRRYSKALEYEYSPSLRRDLIAEADAANRADIDRALVMLQSTAENSPLLARALGRAKEP